MATGTLDWSPCGGEGNECATLEVPLDYADPTGPTIEIALVMRPADDPANRIGSLVYNPGGPGGSGVEAIANAADFIFSTATRARFDIVGFDPRGVGDSEPVECLDTRPELREAYPDEPDEITDWREAAESVARACEENDGEILPHVGTANVARDLDRIREALGDEKLTYLGQSYGTLIGAMYAAEFRQSVRAVVLDAPIDPAIAGDELIVGQATAMDAALERFLANCTDDPRCAFGKGRDREEAFDELMSGFEDAPVQGVSGTIAWNAVALGLMAGEWQGLASALAAAEKGDLSTLEAVGGSVSDPELLDPYAAVMCLDLMLDRSPDAWEDLALEAERVAPRTGRFLSYGAGWGAVECAYWPVAPVREAAPIAAPGVPLLVVGGTGDPATPYAWAESLAGQLDGSVLVTREGEGHGSYGKNACIGQVIDDYLIELAMAREGTICRDE